MNELLAIAVGLAALLLLGVLGMRRRLRNHVVGEQDSGWVMPGGPVGAFVAAVNECGSEADPAYVAAVAALRADGSAAASIERLYCRASAELKPSLLLAAAAAGPSSREFLMSVASSPDTARGRMDMAIGQGRLRLIALGGLERLARDGETAAWNDLERLACSDDRAVQIGAVAALKFGGPAGAMGRLRELLPSDRHYVFDVTRPSVRDVPQIADPRRHLRGPERTAGDRPTPEGTHSAETDAGKRRKGIPKIGEPYHG